MSTAETRPQSSPSALASRGEVLAWASYDWAHSAYSTLSITVLMFFISGEVFTGNTGDQAYGYVIALSTLMSAVLSPVLGAAADNGHNKRKWLAFTALSGAGCSLAMGLVSPDWPWTIVVLYALANLAYELSWGFYNAFLPDIADERSMNRISSLGFGLGYVGGGLALLVVILLLFFGEKVGLPTASADRGKLTSDYHTGTHGEFAVKLAPGRYRVTAHLGDATGARDAMVVTLGGQKQAPVNTKPREFAAVSAVVDAPDGRIAVDIEDTGGRDPRFAINGLDITAEPSPESQSNASAAPPVRWTFDFGTMNSPAEDNSVWVLPGDRFEPRRLDDAEEPRFKRPAPVAPDSPSAPEQPAHIWPEGRPRELEFGWAHGDIRAHDAISLVRLRWGLLIMGGWWGLFSLPALLILRDRGIAQRRHLPWTMTAREAFSQVISTLLHVRRYPTLFLFLTAFLIYNDGVQTVISEAGVFAKRALGVGAAELTLLVLMIQFVAWPGAIIVGRLADRLGNKRALMGCLAVYVVWLMSAFVIRTHAALWIMGVVLALVMGGIQSVSRSIMGMLTPPERSGEFFGFFNLAGKALSALGPLVFTSMLTFSDNPYLAVFSLLPFFIVGGVMAAIVNIARGQIEAGTKRA